ALQFVRKRMNDLSQWLNAVQVIPKISTLPAYQKFCDTNGNCCCCFCPCIYVDVSGAIFFFSFFLPIPTLPPLRSSHRILHQALEGCFSKVRRRNGVISQQAALALVVCNEALHERLPFATTLQTKQM